MDNAFTESRFKMNYFITSLVQKLEYAVLDWIIVARVKMHEVRCC